MYTIQYNTIQYNTIQYNTIQYNTILFILVQEITITYGKWNWTVTDRHMYIMTLTSRGQRQLVCGHSPLTDKF